MKANKENKDGKVGRKTIGNRNEKGYVTLRKEFFRWKVMKKKI